VTRPWGKDRDPANDCNCCCSSSVRIMGVLGRPVLMDILLAER